MKAKWARRLLAMTVTGVMGVTMLAGCGGGSKAPETDSAKEESDGGKEDASGESSGQEDAELKVTVQAWMMGKYDFEGAKTSFEANHPGVTVTYNQVDNVDVTTSMLEWSQGRTSCDIAIGGDRSQTVSYAANDYIVEFTEENFLTMSIPKTNSTIHFLKMEISKESSS